MREIVHLQIGQSGNQIGTKVSYLSILRLIPVLIYILSII